MFKIVNNDLDKFIIDNEDIKDFIFELIEEKYYLKNNLNRYINYYKNNLLDGFSLNTDDVVRNVNCNLDYNFYENYEQTDLSKDTLMIINKHYAVDQNYQPDNLVVVEEPYGYWHLVRDDVYEKFQEMYEKAKLDNITLFIASPYRSYYDQQTIYNSYASSDGVKNADTYSARPGFSEHQSGLALDLIPGFGLELDTFEYSAGFEWMQSHAHEYGFILRYPKDKEYITGYMYEPWHYRYVGAKAATIIKNEDLTFEEYYEYYVK